MNGDFKPVVIGTVNTQTGKFTLAEGAVADELAGLPEDVREALSYFADAETALEGEGHNGTMYATIRAELVRLARKDGAWLSRWNSAVNRYERAEAELAALKRSTQGTVQAVRPQADGCYLVEVCCDSAGVASLFSQRVALLPVGGEG